VAYIFTTEFEVSTRLEYAFPPWTADNLYSTLLMNLQGSCLISKSATYLQKIYIAPCDLSTLPSKKKIKKKIILEEERIWIHLREEIESGRNEI
jgi:hypothetical protein